MLYKLLTTHREVHSGSTKYNAVLLVHSYLTVSSQIIETALRDANKHARTQAGHTTVILNYIVQIWALLTGVSSNHHQIKTQKVIHSESNKSIDFLQPCTGHILTWSMETHHNKLISRSHDSLWRRLKQKRMHLHWGSTWTHMTESRITSAAPMSFLYERNFIIIQLELHHKAETSFCNGLTPIQKLT